MTSPAPLTSIEAAALGLRFVKISLLDRSLEEPGLKSLERRRLSDLLAVVEGTARDAVQHAHACFDPYGPEALLTCMEQLASEAVSVQGGVPTLRPVDGLVQLGRLIDFDAFAPWHRKFCPLDPCADQAFAWSLGSAHDAFSVDGLLDDHSEDQHVHLGGAVPPQLFWLLFVTGSIGIENLRRALSASERHGALQHWADAVSEAAVLRLHLAAMLHRHDRQAFPGLASIADGGRTLLVPTEVDRLALPGMHHDNLSDTRLRWIDDVPVARRMSVVRWMHRAIGGARSASFVLRDPLQSAQWPDASPHPLAAERRLLHGLADWLRDEVDGDARDKDRAAARDFSFPHDAVRRYVRARNAFHQLFVYLSGEEGLDRFSRATARRRIGEGATRRRTLSPPTAADSLREGLARREARFQRGLERFRARMAVQSLVLDAFPGDATRAVGTPRRRLELRVAMPRGRFVARTFYDWLYGAMEALDEAHRRGRPLPSLQLAFVVHFLKSVRTSASDHHSEAIDANALRDANVLGSLLWQYPQLRRFFVGIDAASRERSAPPSAFLKAWPEAMRICGDAVPSGESIPVVLGQTYHVGEDANDLLTVYRHIDEVLTWLFRVDDAAAVPRRSRLGHALLLGVDPAAFYQRYDQRKQPRRCDHVVDLVWAIGRLRDLVAPEARLAAERALDRVLRLAGKEPPPGATVERGWRRWLSAGDRTRTGRAEHEVLRALGLPSDATGAISPEVDAAWLGLLGTLRQWLVQRIIRCGVVVEANPTANLLIGGVASRYGDLPQWRLVAEGVRVSINTDNPGLFLTNLAEEHRRVFCAIAAREGRAAAVAWTRARIVDGEMGSFISNHAPDLAAWVTRGDWRRRVREVVFHDRGAFGMRPSDAA